ncbi:hypothetical protein ADICYQ_0307 [Cyclobacterium qasimii M12-11B]|uniref:Uncharacterized protein n=1 Tax=Cyclobacterium qasimii M12-11B TaxID=641524 RepID=S7X5Z0_9BACT|nr:hypothetical protein ADICYQ_0307 [Cyclobacterium qasimii M12-11B]
MKNKGKRIRIIFIVLMVYVWVGKVKNYSLLSLFFRPNYPMSS